jgi:phage FluMu protein Com
MYISCKVRCPFCGKVMTFNASKIPFEKECWGCNATIQITGARPSGASFKATKFGEEKRTSSMEMLQYEA